MDREDLILELADEELGTGLRMRPEKFMTEDGEAGERETQIVEFVLVCWREGLEEIVDGWSVSAALLRELADQASLVARGERDGMGFTVRGAGTLNRDFFSITAHRDSGGVDLTFRLADDEFPGGILRIEKPCLTEAEFSEFAAVLCRWTEAFPVHSETVEYSCGAVVFTRTDSGIRYVIIESLEGIHGFPKGHMEPGETERETALREIREETGLEVRLLEGFRTEDEYRLPKKPGTIKRVVYFLGEYDGRRPVPQPSELRSAKLLSFDEAMAAFEHPSSRRILREADEFLRR